MIVLYEAYQAFVSVLIAIFGTVQISFDQYPVESSIGLYITICIVQSPIKVVINATFDLFFYLSRAALWLKPIAEHIAENVRNHSQEYRLTYNHDVLTALAYSIPLSLVPIGGAVFNYNLLEQPLALWSTDAYNILGIPVQLAELYAALIIGFEIILGIFLLECLTGSHFGFLTFIRTAQHSRRWTTLLAVAFAVILFLFSIGEVVLAFQRDELIQIRLEIQGSLLPSSIFLQAGVGFLMPWILMITVMPLERVFMAIPILIKASASLLLFVISAPFLAVNHFGESVRTLAVGGFEIIVGPLTITFRFLSRFWDRFL